jgi:hypothetical protein
MIWVLVLLLLLPLPTLQHRIYLPVAVRETVPSHGVGATYADCSRLERWDIFYDWTADPPDCGHRIAMIYGPGNVGAQIADDIQIVVGANEPHNPRQGHATPAEWAVAHHQMEQDYPDKRLGTPSAPIWWLEEWIDISLEQYYQLPRFEYVAHHCYPDCHGPCNPQGAIEYCQREANRAAAFAREYGAEVLVTEFTHLPCWDEGVPGSIEFMEDMVPFYRDHQDIAMWFWFGNFMEGDEDWGYGPDCNTSLVHEDGTLTVLGEAYANAR